MAPWRGCAYVPSQHTQRARVYTRCIHICVYIYLHISHTCMHAQSCLAPRDPRTSCSCGLGFTDMGLWAWVSLHWHLISLSLVSPVTVMQDPNWVPAQSLALRPCTHTCIHTQRTEGCSPRKKVRRQINKKIGHTALAGAGHSQTTILASKLLADPFDPLIPLFSTLFPPQIT